MSRNAAAPALYITSAQYRMTDNAPYNGTISRTATLYVNLAIQTDADRGDAATASMSLYSWIDYDEKTGQPATAMPARPRDTEFHVGGSIAQVAPIVAAIAARFPVPDLHDWTPTPADLAPLRALPVASSTYALKPSQDAALIDTIDHAVDDFGVFNDYAARIAEMHHLAEKFPAPVVNDTAA